MNSMARAQAGFLSINRALIITLLKGIGKELNMLLSSARIQIINQWNGKPYLCVIFAAGISSAVHIDNAAPGFTKDLRAMERFGCQLECCWRLRGALVVVSCGITSILSSQRIQTDSLT